MEKQEQQISLLVTRLVNEFKPKRIFLFGSQAWGIPSEDSDIDLCVILDSSEETPKERRIRARKALRDIPIPKDILVKTIEEIEKGRKVHALLESLILEKGKLVYEC
ncbi:MAG: nucleotidyltransferase domain-containing protein [Chloroherpetonaceae bacterium]|nr:nucleotidyltransferase domain-containing protein [Chloroherpetonaceae bacterium]